MTFPEVQQIPKSQRAWMVVRRGKPDSALSFESDVPVPSVLEKGEVLVKVQAAALNPVGYKLMHMVPGFLTKRPRVAEFDLTGIIANANGSNFSPGDPVFGFIDPVKAMGVGQGALAQYTRIQASHIVSRPANVTPIEAAGIMLAAQTAYQALVDIAKIESGQSVFINGGSTAVGSFAIQIAKAKGCQVVASASGKNEAFVRSLGADEFIDYSQVPLHRRLTNSPPSTKFQVILEAVGLIDPVLYTSSPAYLAPNGVFISVGPQPAGFQWHEISKTIQFVFQVFLRPTWLGGTARRWELVYVNHKRENLEALQKLVAEGKVKATVDSVYSFNDVLKAYDRIMTSRARGKVTVKVDDSLVY